MSPLPHMNMLLLSSHTGKIGQHTILRSRRIRKAGLFYTDLFKHKILCPSHFNTYIWSTLSC